MKKYLSYKDEKSDKFWQIEVTGTEHTVTYGKAGSAGSSKTKTFESDAACLADAQKIMRQKIKKGYQDSENTSEASPSVPVQKKENAPKVVSKEVIPEKEVSKVVTSVEEVKTIEVKIEDPIEGIKTIEEHIEFNELINAGELCEQLLALKLTSEQIEIAHRLQGHIAFLKGDLEKAEEALKQGGQSAYFLLGELYIKKGNFSEAFLWYKKADTYHSYSKGGAIAKDKGMTEEAIVLYKQAIEKGEKEEQVEIWEAYLKLGALYHPTNIKLAEELYIKSIASDLADDRVYNNLGVLYITSKRHPEGLEILDKGIAKFPEHPIAYFNKCCSYAIQGELDDANHWLSQAFHNGYDNSRQLKHDKDLEALRETERFKELTKKYSFDNRYGSDNNGEIRQKHPEILTDFTFYSLPKDNKVPESISKAPNLKELSISGNMKVFPVAICDLKKLEELRISESSIQEFPEEFLNMKIDKVELEVKRIKHFPVELSRQKGLTDLQLSSPKFTEVPKEVARFTTLRSLCIKHASLTNIHREIGSLTSLRSLEIRDTTLKDLPEEISSIKRLYSLTISDNPDLMYLPESIFTLPGLTSVTFYKNGFPSTEATKLHEEGQKNKTEKRLLAIFLALLQDNKSYLEAHAQRSDILQALNSSVKILRNNALIWLAKEAATTTLDSSSQVLILGKFDRSATELKKELAEKEITVAKKWSATTTHVLIGEKPGDKLTPLLQQPCCWITEEQLNTQESKTESVAVELSEVMKQQIKTLLLSTEDINHTIALEMIAASQSTLLFSTSLFLIYQFSGDQNNKKAILSLIKQSGDQKLQTIFTKKYGFKTASEKKVKEYITTIPVAAGFDENEFAHTIFKITKDKAVDYLLENGSKEQREDVLKALVNQDTLKFDSDLSIKTLPEEIEALTTLKHLDVFYLKLKEFPLTLTKLLQLETINFRKTRIKKLPKEIENLQNIKTLDLGSCSFKKFPVEIYPLANLEKLLIGVHYDNSSQAITEIPTGISNLKQLKELDLEGNGVTTLPDDFAQLDALESLNLANNSIAALPENFSELKKLRRLNFTCLDENIPSDSSEILSKISTLEKLVISATQLEAFKNLSKLTNLKELIISGRNNKNSIEIATTTLPNCEVSTSYYGW